MNQLNLVLKSRQLTRLWILAVTVAFFSTGCMTTQLRKRANEQASSIPDVYYQQVLDNLAMIVADPSRMPYFSDPQTARTNIARMANVSYGLNLDLISAAPAGVLTLFNRYLFDKQSATLTGAQTNTAEWAALTDNDPDHLLFMRCAYRRTAGVASATDDALLTDYYFQHYRITDESLAFLDSNLPRDANHALRPYLVKLKDVEFGDIDSFLKELRTIGALTPDQQQKLQEQQLLQQQQQEQLQKLQQDQQEQYTQLKQQLRHLAHLQEQYLAAQDQEKQSDQTKQRELQRAHENQWQERQKDEVQQLEKLRQEHMQQLQKLQQEHLQQLQQLKQLQELEQLHQYIGSNTRVLLRSARMENEPAEYIGHSDPYSLLYLPALQPGWFKVGGWKEVPRNACYVGRYCKTYVWVPAENVEMLTLLTLAILDLHTNKSDRRQPPGLLPKF